DAMDIGPIIVQAFPDTARALGHVRLVGALAVYPQELVGAVPPELRAARPEVGERSQELLGGRGGRPLEVNRCHGFLPLRGASSNRRSFHALSRRRAVARERSALHFIRRNGARSCGASRERRSG